MLTFFRYALAKIFWYENGPYVFQDIKPPAVLATELYPDMKFTTVEEYLRRLL